MNRYIDLTLGASGTTYTAPANGWVRFYGISTSNFAYYALSSEVYIHTAVYSVNNGIGGYIPVRKGEQFTVDHYSLNVQIFRFVYAQGSYND